MCAVRSQGYSDELPVSPVRLKFSNDLFEKHESMDSPVVWSHRSCSCSKGMLRSCFDDRAGWERSCPVVFGLDAGARDSPQ